jgi:hypothetical protein
LAEEIVVVLVGHINWIFLFTTKISGPFRPFLRGFALFRGLVFSERIPDISAILRVQVSGPLFSRNVITEYLVWLLFYSVNTYLYLPCKPFLLLKVKNPISNTAASFARNFMTTNASATGHALFVVVRKKNSKTPRGFLPKPINSTNSSTIV